MPTDYNRGEVPQHYQKSKQQSWRIRIEEHSLMRLIGDLHGKSVVDVACGEGHFTRKLRRAGAARVVGFDISEKMIDLARAQEAAHPLDIDYRVEDARTVVAQQDFDLAVSAWLIVYARDRAELAQTCRGLASWVRPGGRFVTFTGNPDLYSFKPLPDYRKYGFAITLADQVAEGAPIDWTFYLEDATLEIENYYLPVSAYEEAFREAGFGEFQVHLPELAPNPQGEDDSAYWADIMEYPPAILIACVRE